MSTSNATADKSKLLKTAITFIIPIIIALFPTNEVFTYQMKMAIALTVWMLVWSAFDLSNLAIPAVIWAALLMILNVVPATVALGPWLSTTMYGAIGCFLLANVLNECGLLQRVAYWVAIKCGGARWDNRLVLTENRADDCAFRKTDIHNSFIHQFRHFLG